MDKFWNLEQNGQVVAFYFAGVSAAIESSHRMNDVGGSVSICLISAALVLHLLTALRP